MHQTVTVKAIFFFLITLAAITSAHAQPTSRGELSEFYILSEMKSSPRLTAVLQDQRRYVEVNKLNFYVANTAVSEFKLTDIIGEIDIDSAMVSLIKQIMQQQGNRRIADSIIRRIQLKCVAGDSVYDARADKILPDIRFQQCGNCWAYSALGPIESSYIRLRGIADPSTVNFSEKQLVACSGAGDCRGGLTFRVFMYLKNSALPLMHESNLPDDGLDKPCPSIPSSASVRLLDWGVIDPSGDINKIASVTKIKEALCKFGPVAASMNATPLFQNYAGGVFYEQPSDYQNPTSNHAVVIVGWNDSKRAWLVRNSWSTGWGDKGYCWIRYDSNNIGRRAAWVVVK
jgi:cathepsin K